MRVKTILGVLLLICIVSIGITLNTSSKQVEDPVSEVTAQEITKEVHIIKPDIEPVKPEAKQEVQEVVEEKPKQKPKEPVKKKDKIYYKIPSEYKQADLTKDLQKYLYDECKKRDIEYSLALALIERESGYYSKCCGDRGNSKGYMQVWESFHRDIMEAEGVKDLYDPEGNIRVGLDILQSLYEKYGNSGDHCVLMVYNMGSGTANKLWKKGIYSTGYTREVISRAQEIKKDLTQD